MGDGSARSGTPPFHRAVQWLLIFVGLGLRLYGLFDQSLTSDEMTDLEVSRGDASWSDVLKGGKRFPPLYHLVLRIWLKFGDSAEFSRWLALLIGMATLFAIWYLARQILDPKGVTFALGIAAVAPFAIWYSQEVRVYGLFLLLATVAISGMTGVVIRGRNTDWVIWLVGSILGLFTHYYFILVVGFSFLVFLLAGVWKTARRAISKSAVVLLAVSIPWIWLLVVDLQAEWGASSESSFGLTGLFYSFFSFASGYSLGPSLRELHTAQLAEAVRSLAPWLALGVPIVAAILISAYRALRGSIWIWALPLLAVGPVVTVGLASAVGPFGFNVRHVLWAFIPIVLMLAAGLARLPGLPAVVLVLGLLVMFGAGIWGRVNSLDYRNEDSKAVAAFLEKTNQNGSVLVSAGYMSRPIDEYLDDGWSVEPLSDVGRDGDNLQDALVQVEAAASPRFVAYTREFHSDPGGVLLQELVDRGAKLEAEVAGIVLYSLD